jgi:cell division protein FtsI (penicillin-binding protein 3)
MKPVPHLDENPCRPRHYKPAPCGALPQEGPEKELLETSRTRLLLTGVLFALAFAVIGFRLVDLTVLKGGETKLAHAHVRPHTEATRADIVDRSGVLLARTLESQALVAYPKQVDHPAEAARKLVAVLPDLNQQEVQEKLASGRKYVRLKRQLTPDQQFAVNNLGIPGVKFETTGFRVYPKGDLTSAVVGYVDSVDNKGLAGIERGLDDELKTSDDSIELSLDARLQYILTEEVQAQINSFGAQGGMGIIADANSGEIVALASLPSFDPNDMSHATEDGLFNRATLGTYEMGSVFKIFNTARALDNHVTTMAGSYDATAPIHIGRFTIHDDHAKGRWLSVPEIFIYSSNIGSAKMAVEAGADRQKDFLNRLGLLTAPQVEIPEIGKPEWPSAWHTVNTMTIAFGHGISVSPLQMVTGVSAVVNGGVLHRATFLKHPDDYRPQGVRVLSRQTSEDMRRLMRLVVEQGTGKFAAAPGYLVGGKTGTAEEVGRHGYARKSLLSSFIGVFPINAPRYVIMVSIDQPHANAQSHGEATGGWVAAPAVSRIVQRMAPIVGIPPVDEDSPEIRRALLVDFTSSSGRKIAAN